MNRYILLLSLLVGCSSMNIPRVDPNSIHVDTGTIISKTIDSSTNSIAIYELKMWDRMDMSTYNMRLRAPTNFGDINTVVRWSNGIILKP